MEGIKNIAGAVCIVAVIAGISGMLMPEGKFEKVWKLVLSIFFLVCFYAAVNGAGSKFDFSELRRILKSDTANESSLSKQVLSQSGIIAKQGIINKVNKLLNGNNFYPPIIDIDIEINNEEIILGDLTIWLYKSDVEHINDIEKIVKQTYGLNPVFMLASKENDG